MFFGDTHVLIYTRDSSAVNIIVGKCKPNVIHFIANQDTVSKSNFTVKPAISEKVRTEL